MEISAAAAHVMTKEHTIWREPDAIHWAIIASIHQGSSYVTVPWIVTSKTEQQLTTAGYNVESNKPNTTFISW